MRTTSRLSVLQTDATVQLRQDPPLSMEEYCSTCSQHRSVYGAEPWFLEDMDEPIRMGLFFTDLKFAYYPQMGPMLVFGLETWEDLQARGFKWLGAGDPVYRASTNG